MPRLPFKLLCEKAKKFIGADYSKKRNLHKRGET
jgi:hypothetical protein